MIIGRDYQKVLKAVLERIKPTPDEEKRDHAFSKEFVARLDAMTPKNVNIELAGSVAKYTNLRGDRDFDVFLLFAPTYSVKELMTLGLKWAKKIARGHKWEIAYAEHPYLIMWMNGVEIDIVPSFKITEASERITSVDRSPLHTRYINSHITGEQRDNVRLLKKFLKTAGIYGAEGRIRGFSGYLCELLMINYGSFMKLLEEAAEWKETPVIDIVGVAPAKELLKKFDGAAMIAMDPVDKERNVAAAVSKTTLSLFIYTAREFLKRPSQEFFFASSKKVDRKWTQKQTRDRATCILGIEFRKPKVVEDILWPQLYKFTKKVTDRAREQNFSIFDTDVAEAKGKCITLFEFETFELPTTKKLFGPPIWMKEGIEEFIKHHKVTEPVWFEDERIVTIMKRPIRGAEEYLKEVLRKPKEHGVPPDILKNIKTARIIDVNGIMKKYPEFLFAYLQKRNI